MAFFFGEKLRSALHFALFYRGGGHRRNAIEEGTSLGGGGVGGNGHARSEWWINEDGYLGIQRALLVVAAEAGLVGVIP